MPGGANDQSTKIEGRGAPLAGLFRRWSGAVHRFGLETVRLQNRASSIPYLMALNSLFCFVCFCCSREVQCRVLYGLIGFILCTDLVLARRDGSSLGLALLHWLVHDFLRSLSLLLLACSLYWLQQAEEHGQEDKKHKQKALFSSLSAVSCLVLSPLYHHHRVNAKLAKLARQLGLAIRHILTRFLLRPLLASWEWLKFVLSLRWMLMLASRLRSWGLALFDWLDVRLFSPLGQLRRWLAGWLRYFLLLHWCVDLWGLARRVLLEPLCVQLGRLLDGFVYVFGCYWLKPLLFRLGRALGQLAKSFARLVGRLSLSLALLAFEHVFWPLLLMASDQLAQAGLFIHEKAIRPVLAILARKYRLLEDLVLVNLLGPVLKRLLDWLPQKNPFEEGSDHELDEFLPELEEEEGEGEGMPSDSARLLELPEESELDGEGAELGPRHSSTSSQFSSGEEERALALGLRRIDISTESDSDTEMFLPSSRRRRRRSKKADSVATN